MSEQRPRVFFSNLTGHAYVATRYREQPSGTFEAITKHDVTPDVVENLMAAAWARGWNECNAAEPGDAAPNPYRPATASERNADG